MRIGHTLFGGAVAGLVIASGVAACGADALAKIEVTRHAEGQAIASAVSRGECRRVAGVFPSTLTCESVASGAASVDFRPLPVEITCSADAAGSASAEYFAYSFGNAGASMGGAPVLRIRLYPIQARARAFGEAEAQTWQLGYARPAVARAIGFGTTFHVGGGARAGVASGFGVPAVAVGAAGRGLAPAHGAAVGAFTIGAAGEGAAAAVAAGDAAVTVAGVRELSANGLGSATAAAAAGTVGIHQAQTGRATAIIVAYPKSQIGASGRGEAIARGDGDGIGTATGATALSGYSSATATGQARYYACGLGAAKAKAACSGAGEITQTRAAGKPGNAKSTAGGDGVRIALAEGHAQCAGTVTATVRRTVTAEPERVSAQAGGRSGATGLAVRAAPARAFAESRDQAIRLVVGVGFASSDAQGQGANQVNDLLRAPERRTHAVSQDHRAVLVGQELRLLAA